MTEDIVFYNGFVVPFVVGLGVLGAVVSYKFVRWFVRMPRSERARVRIFSRATLGALWECVAECLLHRRIWRVNPLLGYMHTSFALGWALLIAVGWAETMAYFGSTFVPLQGHIFWKFFTAGRIEPIARFEFVMDLLLLYVLSGLLLAMGKRLYSRALGMRRTTRLTLGDRIALSSLWFVFPMRLLAESATAAHHGGGGFLTGSLGTLMSGVPELPMWWGYSAALGVFFVSMPFSRYMHIFTEVPLIFLRRWGVRSHVRETSFDHFQIEACSRCGICLDPCPMTAVGMSGGQSVYFLRDRRYNRLSREVADACLMCGRCDTRCPVGIDLAALRLNSRHTLNNTPADDRFAYARGLDTGSGKGQIGYFAGCMTLLSPRILQSMERIFEATGERVWWADRNGGVCCGRPLKLSGEVDAASEMMRLNEEAFRRAGITTLVTSCPICLRVFREDYRLEGITVLHHSEYIAHLVASQRIALRHGGESLVYHDPCELGRGCGIYDEPRAVLGAVGELFESSSSRGESPCCGASLAGNAIPDAAQRAMAREAVVGLEATGASNVVTACPLCKKSLARATALPVSDLAEVVARSLA